MDGKGRIAVMWRNWLGGSRDMYAAISTDGGATFTPAQKLGAGTWKLHGCPMDGGAIAFNSAGKLLTTWRREKTAFASELGQPERPLADGALQPIVIPASSGARYLWQSGTELVLGGGAGKATRFAENGAFAAATPVPGRGTMVVWESETAGAKTIMAELIE